MAKEKGKPLTREDVLRMIEENGGTAEGLDLSGKRFEEGINLREPDLAGIILNEAKLRHANLQRAVLTGAQLEGADLTDANLEGADLTDANLEGAVLRGANLKKTNLRGAHMEGIPFMGVRREGADLRYANLEGAYLERSIFSYDTKLDGADWGNYILGEEKDGKFYSAESIYRRLKQWYTNAGVYDTAGEFFYREMEAKRKSMKWWPQPWHRTWVEFVSFICGYGERPYRVILWAASVVLGLALIYFAIGSTWEWWAFWNSLYFSAVSFTALGYGTWAYTPPEAWVQGVGAAESFIGVFTIALFLITFTRKMRR